MEKMEHFRNGKLLDGDKAVLEGVDGHLGFHARAHGRREWYGYFELPADKHVVAGAHYNLVLEDGRTAEIYAEDIRASNTPGKATHVAMFYVIGDVRGRTGSGSGGQRSLRDGGSGSYGGLGGGGLSGGYGGGGLGR
jgi:hypothetical protein